MFCLVLAAVARPGHAQETGGIGGVVVSTWNGSPLPNVTITVRGTTLAVQTDASGRYELKEVPVGTHVLRFSKPGFTAVVVTDARVVPGQTTTVNGNLQPEITELAEYEITAELFTEQTQEILKERQESGALKDAIGSELIKRYDISDAGQAVARVPGVSVVGGKYVVVRGLSDRYTRTLLNGVEVPSADPYKLSPQLDLFPSAMIDRISVTKTFTPDQPGGTGGGTIDIATKSFPEKPFLNFSIGTSYNPNSNLKDNFLADPSSSMHMLAFPSGPDPLQSKLFGLTDAPDPPGPASSGETRARAALRRAQADEVQGLLQKLGTANFAGAERDSPLNSSFSASAGETKSLFGHNLGVFGGLNYRREFRAVDGATVNRYSPLGTPTRLGMEQRGNIDTDYGANVNLGYEPWKDQHVGFNFLMAHSTDEEARHASFGFVEGRDDSLEQWQLHFTDRAIFNYQMHGDHQLPAVLNSTFNWVVAVAHTTQDEPDHRFMNYFLSDTGQPTFGDGATPFPQYPSRYFREITEDGLNYRVDWTLPLDFVMKEESKIKVGYLGSSNDRDFKEQYFSYNLSGGFDPNRPNSYLNDPAYLQYVATYLGNTAGGVGRTNFDFSRYVSDTFAHPYTASLDINAVYLMADVGVWPWLRLIFGARVEGTKLNLDAGRDGSSHINQTDLLPAASVVTSLRTNLDLRLSYGETVSRPSYREIAPVQSYLPDLGITALGNPDLQMIAIKSYDARIEWFPGPGDVLSAGLFYKTITDPIELISRTLDDQQVTWINRSTEPADLMGVEFEARKSMEFLSPHFQGLTLGGNVTLIKSSTKLSDTELFNKRSVDPSTDDTRPLYDQSPYIINLDLAYDHPTSGTSFTIGANLTGERLVLAKTQGPDIYEHTPINLYAGISQRLWKHWTLRFNVRNILDLDYRQTYGSDFNDNIFQNYKRGRTFAFALSGAF
ncbi:MAG TPA: TonB-dependent receptor [Verrucomicrobiae bacterium]|nr:TonB-dependent receptor [Verrucomicrobiae bacterium]